MVSLYVGEVFDFFSEKLSDTKLELDLLLRGFLGIGARFTPVGAGFVGTVDLAVIFVFVILEATDAGRFAETALLREELLVSMSVLQVESWDDLKDRPFIDEH